jgi:DNA polymerase-1
MRHVLFAEAATYKVALLIKTTGLKKPDMVRHYTDPLNTLGVPNTDLIGFSLSYNEVGKATAAFIKGYLDKLLPALQGLGTEYLYVADANYFKVLTKVPKADPHFGYVLPCKIKGFEHMNVVLGVNYSSLFYNPELQAKLDMSLSAMTTTLQGTHKVLGSDIIHSAEFPSTYNAIKGELDKLHAYPELTCDIETFGLAFSQAGIGTCAFAWDQHNGIAFACDWQEVTNHISPDGKSLVPGHGQKQDNPQIRALIKQFLTDYKGKLTWHNAAFDIRTLIYTLWMEDGLDTAGLLQGLELLANSFDDTKIIAYLATNSCSGNKLSLKDLAHAFAGNWANSDIKDIRRIALPDLLQYNLVDCLSTWYVKNTLTPVMVADNQEELYHSLMLPSLKVIIQMELSGMPMDQSRVSEAKEELLRQQHIHLDVLTDNPTIKLLDLLVQTNAMVKANAKLKTKQHPLSKYEDMRFNPNSGPQLQVLLYEQMGLPVIDLTDTKQPATGGGTLEKLLNHTTNPAYQEIISALIGLASVSKILSSFIPAFERALLKPDGCTYLHGGFNLGGAVSGRLSSSDPNLQNLPAGSEYGELCKACFVAPEGWLMVGADFNSLEDMISALTTRDPNKMKVYIDKFDGHSLRAASYFREELEAEGIFINMTDPVSVNQLKKTDHLLRGRSKGPTFLLTYGGTWRGMVSNLGWPEDKSKAVEAHYHSLYAVSDHWVADRLAQASKDGYVEVAFGLRVRTPLLSQTLRGHRTTPFEAEAEGRTAGNALGQSYGLLNNRAANDFMQKVWASKYRLDVKPIALIHDAIYLLIKDDVEVVHWVNQELIKSMQWQELPELQHDTVKLGANLGIFWPDWSNECTLPNGASASEIKRLCDEHKYDYLNPSQQQAS